MSDKQSKGWASETEINWDEQSTEAPPCLPQGVFEAVIEKASPKATKAGDPMIEANLKADRAFGEGEGTLSRTKNSLNVYDYLTFLDKDGQPNARKIKQIALATEVPPPKTTGLANVEEFCGNLLEKRVWFRNMPREYPKGSGRFSNNVDRYFTNEAEAKKAHDALVNGTSESGAETEAADAPVQLRRAGKRRAG